MAHFDPDEVSAPPKKRRRLNTSCNYGYGQDSNGNSFVDNLSANTVTTIVSNSNVDNKSIANINTWNKYDDITAMKSYELSLYEKHSWKYIVGIDEAGRGPIAGPIVVCACYIPIGVKIDGIGDSKSLSQRKRETCFDELVKNNNVKYGVSIINNEIIDKSGVEESTLNGMKQSALILQKIINGEDITQINLENLTQLYDFVKNEFKINDEDKGKENKRENKQETKQEEETNRDKEKEKEKSNSNSNVNNEKKHQTENGIDMILVDGIETPNFCDIELLKNVECEAIAKGDSKVYCIAAASIIAKVIRDKMMVEYDKMYPNYQFCQHKGYMTPQHQLMLNKYGPCKIHRRLCNPVKQWLIRNGKLNCHPYKHVQPNMTKSSTNTNAIDRISNKDKNGNLDINNNNVCKTAHGREREKGKEKENEQETASDPFLNQINSMAKGNGYTFVKNKNKYIVSFVKQKGENFASKTRINYYPTKRKASICCQGYKDKHTQANLTIQDIGKIFSNPHSLCDKK